MEVSPTSADLQEYMSQAKRALDAVPGQIGPLIDSLYQAYLENQTVFVIGNGGSAANASHFSQDLANSLQTPSSSRRRFRVLSLTDNVSFITAVANDRGYERVFVEQLATLARPGDYLIAISVSGNSPNILQAVEYATKNEMTTIALTGFAGGELGKMARLHVNIPLEDFVIVESLHIFVLQLAAAHLKRRIASAVQATQ